MLCVMAHVTSGVEYGLHSLLWMVGEDGVALSTRDLAVLQGISPSFLAKIFPKLEKAGLVTATEGVRGGYVLARAPEAISVLQVVDAIEGRKPLFACNEIRARCVLFQPGSSDWATTGLCSIHAVMLQAERAMRDTLAGQSLADLAQAVGRKAPPDFPDEVHGWLARRVAGRTGTPDDNANAANAATPPAKRPPRNSRKTQAQKNIR